MEGLGGTRRLPPLVAENKKEPTNHDGANACPHWNVDLLLLLDGKFDWAEFDCRCVFGVAEPAVDQTEDAGHDKHDGDESCGVHEVFVSDKRRVHAVVAGCYTDRQIPLCGVDLTGV